MVFNQFGSSLSIIQHCFQFLLGRLLAPLRNVFGGTTKSIMVFLKKGLLIKSKSVFILGDPRADSGGEGKSKRAEKYGSKKSKERREEPLGTMSYQTSSKRSPPFWLLIGARKLLCFSGLYREL